VIFVTVGAQMPFDRLIRAVDAWAARTGATDVFAQVGRGGVHPQHIGWTEFLTPTEFRDRVLGARVLVAHAGMGSILTALEHGKPLLVMPRRGDLRETRNDHQVATAERFRALGRVAVAMDERALVDRLDHLDDLAAAAPIAPHASPALIDCLRTFIHNR
jgi:UDP-N-acetylglucosamine transferase subunit ALG13